MKEKATKTYKGHVYQEEEVIYRKTKCPKNHGHSSRKPSQ